MSVLKRVVRRAFGDYAVGRMDYYRKPKLRASWGGAFNGQTGRQQIFRDVCQRIPFERVVETGTYRGTTTEFLNEVSGRDVWTVEANPEYFGFAHTRFRHKPHIHLGFGDSRQYLAEHLPTFNHTFPTFIYLDAHWEEDLPLAEEVDIVFGLTRNAVVMIDDFEVVSDTGYSFDDYGPGKRLCLEYLSEVTGKHQIEAYFPALPGAEESGSRRGSVVLACDDSLMGKLSDVTSLRRHTPSGAE